MKIWPKDIQDSITNAVETSIQTEFTQEDRDTGYAQVMSTSWHELPDNMTNEQAREYLGLPTP